MFYNLNLVFPFVILQRTVNCQINNSKSLQLKFNSLLITLYFLDLISQLAITSEVICFCGIYYMYTLLVEVRCHEIMHLATINLITQS